MNIHLCFYQNYTNFTEILSCLNDSKENATIMHSMEHVHRRDWAQSVFFIIILSVILLLALIGNTLVCVMIFTVRSLRKCANMLITNLAIADMLLVTVDIPFSLTVLFNDGWIFDELVCQLNGVLFMTFGITELWTLTAIALYRYIQICHPDTYRRYITGRLIKGVVVGIWTVAFLMCIPPINGWGNYVFDNGQTLCVCDWSSSTSYYAFISMTTGLFPFVTITYAYFIIIRTAVRSRRSVQKRSRRRPEEKIMWYRITLTDTQLSKISLIIYVIFICCWIPNYIVCSARYMGYHSNFHFETISIVLIYLNTVLDPFIYAFMSGPFRVQFIRLLNIFNERKRAVFRFQSKNSQGSTV